MDVANWPSAVSPRLSAGRAGRLSTLGIVLQFAIGAKRSISRSVLEGLGSRHRFVSIAAGGLGSSRSIEHDQGPKDAGS